MNTSGILTISVNPAESTIGSLHPEACVNSLRRRVDMEGANLARRKTGGLLRALFGATSIAPSWSIILLTVRVAFSAFLLYCGISGLSESLVESVAEISIAALLLPGLATRFFMSASAVAFGLMSGMVFEAGMIPVTFLIIAGISLLLAIAGPGRYSMDAILRRKIFRKIRRYETRKLMENRFSYKAYQYAREY